jgi:hypothetical protein
LLSASITLRAALHEQGCVGEMVTGWLKHPILWTLFIICSLISLILICMVQPNASSVLPHNFFSPRDETQLVLLAQERPMSAAAIEADDFIKVDKLWLRDGKGKPHFVQGKSTAIHLSLRLTDFQRNELLVMHESSC